MLRSCESDVEKANYLVNLDEEVPEGEVFSEDTASAWMTKSFVYKLALQFTSMQMTVKEQASAATEAKPASEEVVEKSAFDVDMEDESQ